MRRNRLARGIGGELAKAEIASARGWTTSWLRALTSATGTPQRLAAAASSMVRADAPIWRIGIRKCRVLREPSVSWLPYLTSSPGACTHMHARPVGFELVGDDHRQAGADAGAHLGAMGDDGHDPVGRDRDEDVRVDDRAVRHRAGAGGVGGQGLPRHHGRRDHEAAGDADALQDAAADDVLDLGCRACWICEDIHDQTPVAARWIAAAMR